MRNAWKVEERVKLRALYEKHGAKWAKIARHFPHRTCDAIRNKLLRDMNFVAPRSTMQVGFSFSKRPSKYSSEEDMHIIEYVDTIGPNWRMISEKLVEHGFHRAPNGVRNRYSRLQNGILNYSFHLLLNA